MSVRRPFRLSFVPLLLAASVMGFGFVTALSACRAVPRGSFAVGWRSTPETTGPAVAFDAGEYEFKNPLAGVFGGGDEKSAADTAKAKADSDAQLKATEDAIAAKAAAAKADADAKAAAAAAAPAQVAAGTLSEADAQKIADAAAMAVAANARAAKIEASFTALSTKYHDLDVKATELERKLEEGKPGWVPKDWSAAGLASFVMGWGLWYVKSRAAKAARAEADKAKADAIAHGNKQLAHFDDMPDSMKANPDGSFSTV